MSNKNLTESNKEDCGFEINIQTEDNTTDKSENFESVPNQNNIDNSDESLDTDTDENIVQPQSGDLLSHEFDNFDQNHQKFQNFSFSYDEILKSNVLKHTAFRKTFSETDTYPNYKIVKESKVANDLSKSIDTLKEKCFTRLYANFSFSLNDMDKSEDKKSKVIKFLSETSIKPVVNDFKSKQINQLNIGERTLFSLSETSLDNQAFYESANVCVHHTRELESENIPSTSRNQNNSLSLQEIIVARSTMLKSESDPVIYQSYQAPPPPYTLRENDGISTIFTNYNPTSLPSYSQSEGRNFPGNYRIPLSFSEEFCQIEYFINSRIRSKFVQKVYSILAVQLLITFSVIAACIFVEDIRNYLKTDKKGIFVSGITFAMLFFMMMCYKSLRRTYPWNFTILFFLTLSMSYFLGAVSTYYDTYIVLTTVGTTAFVVAVTSLLAFNSSFDFTKQAVLLFMVSLVVGTIATISILLYLLINSNVLYLIYSGLAAILLTVFLVYDTQEIIGGRREDLSPEEYIFGVLTIYIDIVLIFYYLLYICGVISRS